MLHSILHAFIIDSKAVDDGFIAGNSEAARLRIAVLWLWSERSNFHEAEAEVSHIIIELAILVKSSCKTYRIRKMDAEELFFQTWSLFFVQASHDAAGEWNVSHALERAEYHVMGSFRVETEKNGLEDMLVHIKMC